MEVEGAIEDSSIFWLAVQNRVLTWDILQQKGWIGLSHCILCKQSSMKMPTFLLIVPLQNWSGQLLNT
jgi:hypothetical protein